MTGTIEAQFNLVAREYDSGRRHFIPCFDDFYEGTTAFAASFLPSPRRVVDLGAGTGLLSMYFYRHFPDAEYILTDVADEMLNVAKQRFSGVKNITFQHLDYTSTLPETEFDLAISALSIHHLENNQKLELFRNLKQKLPSGGCFINYDQFCCDSAEMDAQVNRYWIDGIYRSGLSETELARWQERRKLDRECSISQEIAMLEQCGFKNVEYIYLCGKFAVISAQA